MVTEILSRKLLLIYQMPKTGSQTVEATLQQCHLPHQVLRLHFLSGTIARTMRKALRSRHASPQWEADARKQLQLISRVGRIIYLRRLLSWFRVRLPKIDVITGVREPIGLGLSSVFENHAYLFPNLAAATVEACRTELVRPKALSYIQDWFDLEIRSLLGIDVFRKPFPHHKGYVICENGFARVLVYRSDFLRNLPVMVREFLGCEVPNIINRNLGVAKDYGPAYAEVKARLRLPADFVAAQYRRKLVSHFFSKEERQRLVLRWAEEPRRIQSPGIFDQAAALRHWMDQLEDPETCEAAGITVAGDADHGSVLGMDALVPPPANQQQPATPGNPE